MDSITLNFIFQLLLLFLIPFVQSMTAPFIFFVSFLKQYIFFKDITSFRIPDSSDNVTSTN